MDDRPQRRRQKQGKYSLALISSLWRFIRERGVDGLIDISSRWFCVWKTALENSSASIKQYQIAKSDQLPAKNNDNGIHRTTQRNVQFDVSTISIWSRFSQLKCMKFNSCSVCVCVCENYRNRSFGYHVIYIILWLMAVSIMHCM